MPLPKQDVDRAYTLIQNAQRIVCLCHRNPDGDAIGALLGMGLLLSKNVIDKPILLLSKDLVPEMFHFLPEVMRVQSEVDFLEGDTLIVLDSGEPKLTGFHETHAELFDGTYTLINIDHHPTNSRFGSINLIEPDASSTCEIIVDVADSLQWTIESDIATCLLTGVYTDTGGLLHSNTSSRVYRTVARLLRSGARQQEIVKAVFRTAKLSTLKLWGRVLEKISVTEEGGAISAVTEGDFRATGAHYSELTGAIDYVNAVPGMRFSLILSERDGAVKGSLRTLRDDVDVAQMAGKFSGGGHTKAAGFSLPGKLKPEIRWKVVEDESQSSAADS